MRIGIVGAGHAGIEAAAAVRQAGGEAVVFSDEPVPPYFRPRLPGVAFGRVQLDSILIHPLKWYGEKGIDLRLATGARRVDVAGRQVVSGAGVESFDALILATGAHAIMPRFDGQTDAMPVFPLWNADDAERVLAHAVAGRRLVVVGGGILGLEAALRAAEAGLHVTIVERMNRLMPLQFGIQAADVMCTTLVSHDIAVRTGCSLRSLAASGDGLLLTFESGVQLPADLVVVAVGARPRLDASSIDGLTVAAGIVVDPTMQTSVAGVFAAGDVAQCGRAARCSVREAIAQGRTAGANAVAWLRGTPLEAHLLHEVPVTFKTPELELCAVGMVQDESCVYERLDDGSHAGIHRAVVKREGVVVGVQMIGTREGFDTLATCVV